ncbi:hypothetical protein HMPREF1624_00581 [Sporothrix schenckii ATCC 58251]|uniref:Inner kinetochore subunit AME1 domain-containing protein n=2 Tax=Sporothrix schenckii TaxID=29908 RepID=U7Q344_SPOS1|nr:hypothetical protein HMPREF1624_00581 [Sporothrix schenckii ATCC 58251]
MASRREERMQQRMRGAQRHQVQDASFDLFMSLPETHDAPANSPQAEGTDESPAAAATSAAQPTAAVRATPNSSAKRRRLSDDGRATPGGGGDADGSTATKTALAPRISTDSQDRPAEEEISESPVDAPGSGRRQSVAAVVSAAATSRSAALQQILSNAGSSRSSRSSRSSGARAANAKDRVVAASSSSPTPTAVAAAAADVRANSSLPASSSPPMRRSRRGTGGLDELSPELSTVVDVPSTGGVGIDAAAMVAAETTKAEIQGKKAGVTTRGGRGGSGVFSKLAKSKQSGANSADELSSPTLTVVLESPDNSATGGTVASSSPLAQKATAGSRAARAAARAAGASRLSGESQNSESTTPQGPARKGNGKDKENASEEEPDELSPDQQQQQQQQQRPPPLSPATGRTSSRIQRASVVPSSSPITRPTKRMPLQPPTSSPRQPAVWSPRRTRGRPPAKAKAKESVVAAVEAEAEEDEDEQAEEIDVLEAANTIGRKRPRRGTVHEPSPELGLDPKQTEPGAEVPERAAAQPAAKRRRRKNQEQSTDTQTQPRPPKATNAKASVKRKRRRDEAGEHDGDDIQGEEEGEDLEGVGKAASRSGKGESVPITVQRFSQLRRKSRGTGANGNDDDDDGDGDDNDELATGGVDLSFANRSGVNAVDVLAQICEDLVEQKLQSLHEKHQHLRQQQVEAGDDGQLAAARKEAIVARRAIESFQMELRARLLEQAVAVDALHALRKRVRAAQKSKLALREEILRIRAERDQVALRMDALRAQHQDRVGQAMKTANISSTMHDMDLAIEQGRAAPELTPAQQKAADLANLELTVRRIAEQVSGGGGSLHGGGTLQQLVDFNDFLERTAVLLEGRKLKPKALAA